MGEIAWQLLNPVDTGALALQGFQTGMSLVKGVQTKHALSALLANPDDAQAYNALAYFDPGAANAIQDQAAQHRKAVEDARTLATRKSIGAQYAGGDTAGAQKAALASGDFELAQKFNELDDASRKGAVDFWKAAGPIAFELRQKKDPAERLALWQQARPILAASASDPSLLDKFDPTNDTQLEAAITTSRTVEQLIEQGKITWHQQGEQPSFATDFMGRPVGTANPYAKGMTPTASTTPPIAAKGGFDAAVDHVLSNEGGYNASDMNGKPVNFGINQGANPDINVKSLTRDQAKKVYFDRYWKPSGAEDLPANMQAPYFDVYIRNPKIAKEALSASGGDPQKFMELSSGYFQSLAQGGSGKKYGKAWAERDRKNLQIATGGNATAADGTPHIASKKDFDALPSGTTFIAPDGTRRIKP